MRPVWFLRMALWVRRPPSTKRVILVLSVLGLCLLIFAAERLLGPFEWIDLPARRGWR